MSITQRKVLAYITHGNRLLVFCQPASPDAGIQVPGGTMEPNEAPREAVLREATEETGLTGLVVGDLLGEHRRTIDEITYHRYVFHLTCLDTPPETWQHDELFPSVGDPTPILFDFFWVDLPEGVPLLISAMDRFVPRLNEVLGLGQISDEHDLQR